MGWTSDRYVLAPVVWLYPAAAYMVITSVRSVNRLVKLFAVLAIISCPIMWADKAFSPPDPYKLARKEAGEWILSRAGPDKEVITNRSRIAFYAHGKFVPLANPIVTKEAHLCIAVDIRKEDGKAVKERLDTIGIKPDRTFKTIYVYLPQVSP